MWERVYIINSAIMDSIVEFILFVIASLSWESRIKFGPPTLPTGPTFLFGILTIPKKVNPWTAWTALVLHPKWWENSALVLSPDVTRYFYPVKIILGFFLDEIFAAFIEP